MLFAEKQRGLTRKASSSSRPSLRSMTLMKPSVELLIIQSVAPLLLSGKQICADKAVKYSL